MSLDPFEYTIDWLRVSSDIPRPVDGVKFPGMPGGMVEHFDLADMRRDLEALPEVEGSWPNPASLSRFGGPPMSARQFRRFMSYVKPAQLDWVTPCWLWNGGTHDKGYGRFYLGTDPNTGQRVWSYSHRIAFEHWIGLMKPGYVGDHQCNHKICCNPTHVWPETNNENLRLADMRRPWKRRNQYSKE